MIAHEIHSIKRVRVVEEHAVDLLFEDGTQKVVDLSPILEGETYSPLRDPAYFRQVRLDRDFETIVWPNGADFDPETLYHWERCRDGMIKMANRWRQADER